jgi:RES domain-containing protein
MLAGPKLQNALSGISPLSVNARLSRVVDFFDLTSQARFEFLYTSGRPNRFNPRGLQCLYLADERETCMMEIRENDPDYETNHSADTTYRVEVQLARALDLLSDSNRSALGLTDKELFAPWRRAKRPTSTQRLGKVVSEGDSFSCIRYPSNAAHKLGQNNWNLVVFRSALAAGETIRIKSPDGKHLEQWP